MLIKLHQKFYVSWWTEKAQPIYTKHALILIQSFPVKTKAVVAQKDKKMRFRPDAEHLPSNANMKNTCRNTQTGLNSSFNI